MLVFGLWLHRELDRDWRKGICNFAGSRNYLPTCGSRTWTCYAHLGKVMYPAQTSSVRIL